MPKNGSGGRANASQESIAHWAACEWWNNADVYEVVIDGSVSAATALESALVDESTIAP